jgi:hypothetical protein
MHECYSDALRQAEGISEGGFWDSYENGTRRRLEKSLADVYGTETSILLNSGMSAVSTCLDALDLMPGDQIIAQELCYFETIELLARYERRGVRVHRFKMDTETAAFNAADPARVKAILFESSLNTYHCYSVGFDVVCLLARRFPSAFFICDSTLDSAVYTAKDKISQLPELAARFVFVESVTKFISRSCMAGMITGCSGAVEPIRAVARNHGQFLQEKAFNWIMPCEIGRLRERLALHRRNADIFGHELLCNSNKNNRDSEFLIGSLSVKRSASLFFLKFLDSKGNVDILADTYASRSRELGISIPIRSGYGWDCTNTRAYSGRGLRCEEAPDYVRISIGIEPEKVVVAKAKLLAAIIGESVCF